MRIAVAMRGAVMGLLFVSAGMLACKAYGRFWEISSDSKTVAATTVNAVYGKGTDGALTVSSVGFQANSYTHVTDANITAAATSFNVSDASQFAIGNEILLIQMQGGVIGNFRQETLTISGITGNNIQVSSGILNSYTSGTFNVASASVTQVVRIPQYTAVTINAGQSLAAKVWDGQSGGIIFIRVQGLITVDGTIDAKATGYRGGNGTGDNYGGGNASPGESWSGKVTGNNASNAANNGGGGAAIVAGAPACGSNLGHASGGSGGYAAAGAAGTGATGAGASGVAGSAYGSSALTNWLMGSGGGGSAADNGCVCFTTMPGGTAGGGIVVAYSGAGIIVTGSGKITAEGADAGGDGNCGYGNAGAGAGGSMYLISPSLSLGAGQTLATGGATGTAASAGRIRLDYNSISGSTNPVAGFTASAP